MANTFPKQPHNVIITLDLHDGVFLQLVPPAIPPAPLFLEGKAFHIGLAKESMSSVGLGTDKWNNDVQVDGTPICSRGNSAWPIAPHWNLFPVPGLAPNPNLLIPVLIVGSKSKNILAAGSVVAKEGPIAVTLPFVKFMGRNNACADPVPMPSDVVIHTGATVEIGFSMADLLSAALHYGVDALIDQATRRLGKSAGKAWKSVFKGGVLKRINANVLNKLDVREFTSTAGDGKLERLMNLTPGPVAETSEVLSAVEGKLGVKLATATAKTPIEEAIKGTDWFRALIDKKSEVIAPPIAPRH